MPDDDAEGRVAADQRGPGQDQEERSDTAQDGQDHSDTAQNGQEGRSSTPQAQTSRPRFRPERHHRDAKGGGPRAAVLGISDGLVSNVALILGVAGAHPHATAVRLAGLSGLLAGACSMALGEYVSMQGQKELFERELSVEREEIEAHPGGERKELQAIYMDRGVSAEVAGKMADELMSNSDVALDAHARDELGLDPEELGSPYQAAGSSFLAFAVGAFVPLVSWFFLTGMIATIIAISVTLAASAGVGVVLGAYSGKSMFRSAARQVLLSATAAGITFGVGRLLGASGAA